MDAWQQVGGVIDVDDGLLVLEFDVSPLSSVVAIVKWFVLFSVAPSVTPMFPVGVSRRSALSGRLVGRLDSAFLRTLRQQRHVFGSCWWWVESAYP